MSMPVERPKNELEGELLPSSPHEQQELEIPPQRQAPTPAAASTTSLAVARAAAKTPPMTDIDDQEHICWTLASDEDVDRKLWGMRPPSSTSWARLSGAADLLSTIFRFLQLRELNAMYVFCLCN